MGGHTIIRVVSDHSRALGMTLVASDKVPRRLEFFNAIIFSIMIFALVLANPDFIRPHASSAPQASSDVTWMTISLFFIPRCYIGRFALCGTRHRIVARKRRDGEKI